MEMNNSLRKDLKNFAINYFITGDGCSFFFMVPTIIFYGWLFLDFKEGQIPQFLIISSIIFPITVFITYITNWFVIAPVVRYFRKLLRGEEASLEEYETARTRLLKLPRIHSITGAVLPFFNLSLAFLPMCLLIDLKLHVMVIMWLSIPLCAGFDFVVYFPRTESLIQGLLNRGVFAGQSRSDANIRYSLLARLTIFSLLCGIFPFFVMVTHLYNVVESKNISHPIIYAKVAILLGLLTIFSAFLIRVFNRSVLEKVRIVMGALERIRGGDLAVVPQDIAVIDEIALINHSIHDTKDRLRAARDELGELNRELEIKVQNRTEELNSAMQELEATNQQLVTTWDALWREMQLAKQIQTMLLPEEPEIKGYEISVYIQPMDNVGGDYYDIINASGMDWVAIGDVSGHGVPSGLIMMMVQTAINVTVLKNPCIKPSELLIAVNNIIKKNVDRLGGYKYMTITVLAVQKDGEFHFSGLHQDILIYRAQKHGIERVETSGKWLGLMEEFQGMLRDDILTLSPGDVMLLYTDGITEAWKKGSIAGKRKPEEEMFGEDRLANIMIQMGERTPDDIKNSILSELEGYDCTDDVTMVILKRVVQTV
jgi:serine phosphatase RsbU (regulator of sigma subunit)